MITITAKAFGEYYYEPGQAMFSNRGVVNTCLSNELAKLEGKRVCMTSETENLTNSNVGGKLRVDMLKKCTGNDKSKCESCGAVRVSFIALPTSS
jgi:hypothetical protein